MLMGRLYGSPLGHAPLRQGRWCSWRCARQGERMLFLLGIAVLFVVLLALVVLFLAWAMGDRPGRTP
jgi:hypothetical protein